MSEITPDRAPATGTEARDRVRFEEEALELSDQVYRVARRLVGTREEAEDLDAGDLRARLPQLAAATRPARTCARGCCASSRT